MKEQIQVFFFPRGGVLSKHAGYVAFDPYTEIFGEGINVSDAFAHWWQNFVSSTHHQWRLATKPELTHLTVLYGDSSANPKGEQPIFQLTVPKKQSTQQPTSNNFLRASSPQNSFVAVCPSTQTFYYVAQSSKPMPISNSNTISSSAPSSPHGSPMHSSNNLFAHSLPNSLGSTTATNGMNHISNSSSNHHSFDNSNSGSPPRSSLSGTFFPSHWIEWQVVAMKGPHIVEC